MTNSPPSRNISGDDTLIGLLELFKAKLLQNTDDMLPAKVIAYDRATNRAQVQPLIEMVDTSGNVIPRAQIASVPVFQWGAGGFVISFPVNTNDLGWIKANDRDISLFKKNYAQSAPNTQRKHDFSDAMFIPDSMMKGVTIHSEDSSNLVIQTLSGDVRIAIWDDKVKITAPSVILDTPTTTCTGALIVNGTSDLKGAVTADSTIEASGDITTHANLQVDGDLTINGVADINGIPFDTHRHTGVQTGGGDTGGPI